MSAKKNPHTKFEKLSPSTQEVHTETNSNLTILTSASDRHGTPDRDRAFEKQVTRRCCISNSKDHLKSFCPELRKYKCSGSVNTVKEGETIPKYRINYMNVIELISRGFSGCEKKSRKK